ncbi:hypothetical protein C7M84_021459 [Penaeus vannamei]|uniref:Uncharacterized protein n=1 Tax=Penaeus vannamei TaxID=6689 RepID=A0A3R7QNR7_PENVA|nr:hypothetical protein C7M84_021459 [Penaeus vannamei]
MQRWLEIHAGRGRTGREVWHCAGVVWISERGLETTSENTPEEKGERQLVEDKSAVFTFLPARTKGLFQSSHTPWIMLGRHRNAPTPVTRCMHSVRHALYPPPPTSLSFAPPAIPILPILRQLSVIWWGVARGGGSPPLRRHREAAGATVYCCCLGSYCSLCRVCLLGMFCCSAPHPAPPPPLSYHYPALPLTQLSACKATLSFHTYFFLPFAINISERLLLLPRLRKPGRTHSALPPSPFPLFFPFLLRLPFCFLSFPPLSPPFNFPSFASSILIFNYSYSLDSTLHPLPHCFSLPLHPFSLHYNPHPLTLLLSPSPSFLPTTTPPPNIASLSFHYTYPQHCFSPFPSFFPVHPSPSTLHLSPSSSFLPPLHPLPLAAQPLSPSPLPSLFPSPLL